MLVKHMVAVALIAFLLPACASNPGSGYGSGTVPVKGYYRSNGTYVAPHTRTAPDGILSNNRSYRSGGRGR